MQKDYSLLIATLVLLVLSGLMLLKSNTETAHAAGLVDVSGRAVYLEADDSLVPIRGAKIEVRKSSVTGGLRTGC